MSQNSAENLNPLLYKEVCEIDFFKQATIDDRWLYWKGEAKFCEPLRYSVIYDNLCETVLLTWRLSKLLNSAGRLPYANR